MSKNHTPKAAASHNISQNEVRGGQGDIMPKKPPKACATPCCSGYAYDGPYCEKCKVKAAEQKKADSKAYEAQRERPWGTKASDPRYNTPRWRNLRTIILNREPFCRPCKIRHKYNDGYGEIRPAVDVDHIKAVYKGGDFWNEDNLMPICRECHQVKTGFDKRKKEEEPYFHDVHGVRRSMITGEKIEWKP
jgi:5-methylcytosine-specific restriction endonuclease McrA